MLIQEFGGGYSCGTYGYVYNDVAEAELPAGDYVCGTAVSGEAYYTFAFGIYWNQGDGEYEEASSATSPDQTGDVVSAGEPAATTVTLDGSQVTEGPVPQSAFNGGPVTLSEVPDYIGVQVGKEIVGYTPASNLIPAAVSGPALPSGPYAVYNASLQTVVGHLVSGEGFVASPGSGLPSTFPSGVNASSALVAHTR